MALKKVDEYMTQRLKKYRHAYLLQARETRETIKKGGELVVLNTFFGNRKLLSDNVELNLDGIELLTGWSPADSQVAYQPDTRGGQQRGKVKAATMK